MRFLVSRRVYFSDTVSQAMRPTHALQPPGPSLRSWAATVKYIRGSNCLEIVTFDKLPSCHRFNPVSFILPRKTTELYLLTQSDTGYSYTLLVINQIVPKFYKRAQIEDHNQYTIFYVSYNFLFNDNQVINILSLVTVEPLKIVHIIALPCMIIIFFFLRKIEKNYFFL